MAVHNQHTEPEDTTVHNQPMKPENIATMTHHPGELLRQVARAMNWRDTEISITVPMMTTWKTVLHAVDSALGDWERPIMITTRRSRSRQERLRQIALENVRFMNSSSSVTESPGLPIRTKYDINSLPSPKRSSEETRMRLREEAMPFMPFRQPYHLTLHASITEKTLPVVKAKVIVSGIDGANDDLTEEFDQIDMIWDTGAPQTIITEDLLSDKFRRFLRDPMHDPYRSQDGVRVLLDASIGLSNVPIQIEAIVLVVPKRVVPNERIGILFGQKQCIDHLSYRSIPHRILNAKGENIDEGLWGDIVLDELVDDYGNIHHF